MNHAIPTHAEWVHAGIVLGTRSLVLPGDPLPLPSLRGAALVQTLTARHRAAITLTERTLEAIARLEPTYEAVGAPDDEALREAYAEYLRRTRPPRDSS